MTPRRDSAARPGAAPSGDTRQHSDRQHSTQYVVRAGPRGVIFSRYGTRREAELAAERLRRVGCGLVVVEPARPGDVPGLARRAP